MRPADDDLVAQFAALSRRRRARLMAISLLLDEAAAEPVSLQPCGTWAAYKRHLRRGEDPCAACRQASRDRDERRRAQKRRERLHLVGPDQERAT